MCVSNSQRPRDFREVLELIQPDLEIVEHKLSDELRHESILPAAQSVLQKPRLRVRSALHLLAGNLCECRGPAAVTIAFVIELMQLASIVHSEIQSNTGRHVNGGTRTLSCSKARNILAGDWLWIECFVSAITQRNYRVLALLIAMGKATVETQMIEASQNERFGLRQAYRIYVRKAAQPIGICMQLAAVLADRSSRVEACMYRCGFHLGLALQFATDLLAITDSKPNSGSLIIEDQSVHNWSLPLVYALERSTGQGQIVLMDVMRQKGLGATSEELAFLVKESGGIEWARSRANKHVLKYHEFLYSFPDSKFRRALHIFAETIAAEANL